MKVLVKNVRGLADMCMQVRCSALHPAYTCPTHLQGAHISPVPHCMFCSPQYGSFWPTASCLMGTLDQPSPSPAGPAIPLLPTTVDTSAMFHLI